MKDVLKTPDDASKPSNNSNKTSYLFILLIVTTIMCLIYLLTVLNSFANVLSQPTLLIPTILFLVAFIATIFTSIKFYQGNNNQSVINNKEAESHRQKMALESQRAKIIEEDKQRKETAVSRLIAEIDDLAQGDLTVSATVTDDFTGEIAKSVNFAITELRKLAKAINKTAIKVAQSSEQTQLTAVELAKATQLQAQEIASVSTAIDDMASSIEQVSISAAKSANVAKRSVDIAHNGVLVVNHSIEGMNNIRNHILDTSKRIKRLGESSQEIGDIIRLITDISDQTNLLALNASIQATAAGESGRGFAVVADEVQHLAERSSDAAKQVETLVNTIQMDTNAAIISMESTTTEVVTGVGLAQDAGEALQEVQSISNKLSNLIEVISGEAQRQSTAASQCSKAMTLIDDITKKTTLGTQATANSVNELNKMANGLQNKASRFKLDQDDEILLMDVAH